MTLVELIDLALGKQEGRHVDLSIPQPLFDRMTIEARADIAGFYYAPECRLIGRVFTRSEMWTQLRHLLSQGSIIAVWRDGHDTQIFDAEGWGCLPEHIYKKHILLKTKEKFTS